MSGARAVKTRILSLFLILLLAAPQLFAAAVTPPQLPDPGTVPGYDKEKQEALGQKAMSEVYKQMPILPDSDPVARYVQQLGQKLVGVIPRQYSWPYQFHVVEQKDINAFALPGGPIFVNVGTITAAGNEAELAGVMAHEMSHIYMQHSAKAIKKENSPGGIAARIAGGVLGAYGGLGSLASLGIAGVFLHYSRADEAQADAVGAIIMYKAGYNPKAMADFFRKLEEQGGGSGPQFLSDHPNPGNRYEAITKEVSNWPPKQWLPENADFQQIQSGARAVKAYTAQQIQQHAKSGGGWNNAPPSSMPASAGNRSSDNGDRGGPTTVSETTGYKTLQRNGFAIQYPENWEAWGDPHLPQAAVTIGPPGGVGQNATSTGVTIDTYKPANPGAQLSAQTQDLIGNLQRQNPGLRPVGSPQNITVNGIRGLSVDLMGTSPLQDSSGRPLPEHDWLVALPRQDGSLLYLVFISPERDFAQLRPSFEGILRNLKLDIG